MLKVDDLDQIRCPDCHGGLRFEGRSDDLQIRDGVLNCAECRIRWRVDDGWAHLYHADQVAGPDQMMRFVYDRFAGLHDAGVRYAIPLWGGGTEKTIREGYMRRLRLQDLRAEPKRKLRILEVGIGTGANLPLMLRDLPDGLEVEIWGVDLSQGMLCRCEKRIRRDGIKSTDGSHIRLMMADAHRLPFPPDTFDRVFHVGGIAAFREPGVAMAEMARVARPGTQIVVVDEALDTTRQNNLYHRAMFRLMTLYDPDPHIPREHVPYAAHIEVDEFVSRFYYCLSFSVPDPHPR